MQIEQIIRFDRYFVRKTGDHTGELLRPNGTGQNYPMCCLNCVMDARSEEEHVVDILAACRALDITTLTVGHAWETIIPSVTVSFNDALGRPVVITEELELERSTRKARILTLNHSEEIANEYLEKRRSLYKACGVPCPLGAG